MVTWVVRCPPVAFPVLSRAVGVLPMFSLVVDSDRGLSVCGRGLSAGNLYLIQGVPGIDNLHFYYDSGANQFTPDVDRPLTPAGITYLNNWAKDIIVEFPRCAAARCCVSLPLTACL